MAACRVGAPPSGADDIWAAAVLLYYGATGKVPFPGANDADVLAAIEWLPPSPIADHGCDAADVQEVLERVLSKKRDDRITTAGELRHALTACRGETAKLTPLEVSERIIVRLASMPSDGQDVIAEWLMDDEEPTHDIIDEPSSDDLVAAASSADRGDVANTADASSKAPAVTNSAARPQASPHRSETAVTPVGADAADRAAPGGKSTTAIVAAVGAVAVVAGLLFALSGGDESSAATKPGGDTVRPTTAAKSVPSARPTDPQTGASPVVPPTAAAATATTAPSATPTTKPTAPPHAPAADGDVDNCVAGLFPEDTFSTRKARFEFLCTETDPIEGCLSLRSRIVWAGTGRPMTGGMKEWSQLIWYDMATLGIIRARCCTEAPDLVVPGITTDLAACGLQEALAGLTRVVVHGSDEEVTSAVDGYTKAVRCLSKVGASKHFGYPGGLTGGEITYFRKFLGRVRGTAR